MVVVLIRLARGDLAEEQVEVVVKTLKEAGYDAQLAP